MDFIDKVRTIVEQHPRSFVCKLKRKLDAYNAILNFTNFLPSDTPFGTRVFYYLNSLTSIAKCKYCGKELIGKAFKANATTDDLFCYDCRKNHFNEFIEKSLSIERTFTEDEIKKIEEEFDIEVRKNGRLTKFRNHAWSREGIYILQYLNFKYSHLKNYSWNTKFYWWLKDLKDFPKCEICGEPIIGEVHSISRGYPMVHDGKCKFLKCEDTNLKRHGCRNFGNSEEGRRKAKETMNRKYGCDYFSQTDEWLEKSKKSSIEHYGVPFFRNVDKAKQTKIERYGDENFNNRESAKQTCVELYGHENTFQVPLIREKALLSRLNKIYDQFSNDLAYPLFSKEEYLNMTLEERHNPHLKWHCNKCGNDFESPILPDGGYSLNGVEHIHTRCPTCFPKLISEGQKDVEFFIEDELGIHLLHNDKRTIAPFELDLMIPDRNIAIEFDGLYWHREGVGKGKKYHLNKTEECEQKGIRLIHIFENEWINKKEIVKSRLRHLFNKNITRIGARKCEIAIIKSNDALKFLDENHIQGKIKSTIYIGLKYNGELVSLMTFSKSRFDNKHEWEMTRFCNKLNCSVVGGASKLLKHFEENYKPRSLVSYADRRWSQGNLYEQLGFTFVHASEPNYWYFNKTGILESRIKYQKHKLKDLLPDFNPDLSESQNMKNNGYDRIFDCGNLVYEKLY